MGQWGNAEMRRGRKPAPLLWAKEHCETDHNPEAEAADAARMMGSEQQQMEA